MNKIPSDRAITAIIAVLFAIGGGAAVAFSLDFIAWICWGLIFVVLETRALVDDEKDDTLSEQIWKGTLSKSFVWAIVWKTTTFSFLSWLIYHLLFGVS